MSFLPVPLGAFEISGSFWHWIAFKASVTFSFDIIESYELSMAQNRNQIINEILTKIGVTDSDREAAHELYAVLGVAELQELKRRIKAMPEMEALRETIEETLSIVGDWRKQTGRAIRRVRPNLSLG